MPKSAKSKGSKGSKRHCVKRAVPATGALCQTTVLRVLKHYKIEDGKLRVKKSAPKLSADEKARITKLAASTKLSTLKTFKLNKDKSAPVLKAAAKKAASVRSRGKKH